MQAQLNGMQTQQSVFFRDILVAKNLLGSMQAFYQDGLQRLYRFGSGDAVFRKAWFLPVYYAGNSITPAERQILRN